MACNHWHRVKLADVVEINPHRPLSRRQLSHYVAMDDIVPHTRKISSVTSREFNGSGSRFWNGDTLLARITPCLENGKTAFVDCLPDRHVAHGSTEFIVLSGIQDVTDNLFVYYLARDPGFRTYAIQSMEGTSGRQRVPAAALAGLDVGLPPLEEQRAIAAILGALDDKIELNRRMNETLEAMARAIFKSWFVDFDPVRAKAEGRRPVLPLPLGEGRGEGLDTATAALFPDSFEDSSLGKIPKGWRVAALLDVVEINPPRQLSKGQIAPYLDMQNMPTHGHRPAAWINRLLGSGTKFMNGDTLLARITPCLENGKTAFVDFLEDGQVGWGSTEYIVLRPKPPLLVEYGYYLARSEDLRTYAIQNMTGSSGRQRVPADCFGQYLISIPPPHLAERFGEFARSVMGLIRSNDDQSRTLAAIRDALLPKLLSGEIRVKDAEKFMERQL